MRWYIIYIGNEILGGEIKTKTQLTIDSDLQMVSPSKLIRDPCNLRLLEEMEAKFIKDLAASIKENGVEKPVCAREHNGKLSVYDGWMRVSAAKEANCPLVPVIVRNVDDKAARLASWNSDRFQVSFGKGSIYNAIYYIWLDLDKHVGRTARIMGVGEAYVRNAVKAVEMRQYIPCIGLGDKGGYSLSIVRETANILRDKVPAYWLSTLPEEKRKKWVQEVAKALDSTTATKQRRAVAKAIMKKPASSPMEVATDVKKKPTPLRLVLDVTGNLAQHILEKAQNKDMKPSQWVHGFLQTAIV